MSTALDAGASCIVQPFDLNAIEWRVLAGCARANIHQVFRGRDLYIDATESTVTVSGRPITLTALEATLLRVLVHNRNRTLSRPRLEQGIWGVTRSRTLDVHIARLRQKLGPLGHRIETVPKVGYRYMGPSSPGPLPLVVGVPTEALMVVSGHESTRQNSERFKSSAPSEE